MFVVKRCIHNPILGPRSDVVYDSFSAFNANPIKVGSQIHLLYRGQSSPEYCDGQHFSLSTICKATTPDGISVTKRDQFIVPEELWERYGCEDPRVTKVGSKYYIFYTALSTYPFGAQGIKVAVAISKDMKTVQEKHLVTPFNAKAMTLFSEKINGKYVALLTVNPDLPPSRIAVAEFDSLDQMWDETYWQNWYAHLDDHVLEIPKLSVDHLEVGACPVKTKHGWILVYARIQDYLTDHKIFGVEVALLDKKNPRKILGKTRGPLLTPQEQYEKYGTVPNVIFPSGAMIKGGDLYIYYGATDTTVAVATVPLEPLVESMRMPHKEVGFKRQTPGELLVPRKNVAWESKAIFNPAAIDIDGKISILYRAMSEDNTSVIGLAESKNGTHIDYRSPDPIYVPREGFERKGIPNGNSGCEDPRLTRIGKTIYMYYTAYNGITPPSVAETNISVADFSERHWNWSKPVLVTADGVDDKDGCLHPETIKGKYFLFHRVDNHICGDYGSSPEFVERNNFRNIPILYPRKGMWDSRKVGISVPPIKTKKGWLLLYHGVSDTGTYRVGAALLDLDDPSVVLSRTTDYIFEPRETYELDGQVDKVVFPCGAVVRGDKIFMYYGGADSVIDVATVSLKALLGALI